MSSLNWLESVDKLNSVGPVTTKHFAELGIHTIKDLMFHFPFRFENMQERELGTIMDGEKVTLKGTVVSPPVVNFFGGRKSRLMFRLSLDSENIISVVFFNQPYLAKSIELGQEQAVFGKWQSDRQSLQGMKLIRLSSSDNFAPIYSSTKGLKQGQITKALKAAFDSARDSIEEVIPVALNDKYQLIELNQALYQMHFPQSPEQFKQAERKIIFQEFFMYQWRLQTALQQSQQSKGVRVMYDNDALKDYIQKLPYDLTAAQKRAVNEICFDLLAPYPMRRMLQGDVGSGKTLVAFIAMLAAVIAGYQSVLMVPTEILAKQHVKSFNKLFNPMGLKAELLVSAMTAKDKQAVIDGLKAGRIRLVIGTHALIQPAVQFKQLGLVIIDEQHRFGVGQRQSLMDKNTSDEIVNILQMTATPIPRSLALAVYGDMTVSTIDQMPKGRQPIETKVIDEDNIESVYEQIETELKQGHQVYYVLPLIDQSESLDQVENVNAAAEKLNQRFPNYEIGTLHGQLDKDSQQSVMKRFEENDIQILVATTMVEVGVDVPNATVMVIQSAERFGLAQLHQLRGRVGRSDLQSYCYLIAKPTTEEGKQRIAIMENEADGFVISKEDLRIRGMGDMLGYSQSGLPNFNYANLFEDQKIHTIAQAEVKHYLANDFKLSEAESKMIDKWLLEQKINI